MLGNLLTKLIGTVIPSAADWAKEREQRKAEVERLRHERQLAKLQGKIEWEKALTKRASESEGRDHEWEIESIRNSGWKDELVIIVLTIPLVLVFIPIMAPYVLEGFRILETTPEWYRWIIMMIYCATFGIRLWRRKL